LAVGLLGVQPTWLALDGEAGLGLLTVRLNIMSDDSILELRRMRYIGCRWLLRFIPLVWQLVYWVCRGPGSNPMRPNIMSDDAILELN
jgi:hypothetical protein